MGKPDFVLQEEWRNAVAAKQHDVDTLVRVRRPCL